MGSLSDWAENKCLDHIFNSAWTPAPDKYIALCKEAPTDASTGSTIVEPSGGGYERKAFNTWTTAAARKVANNGQIIFEPATGVWGTVTHWAICTASSGGEILAWGAFTVGIAITTDYVMIIKSVALEIEFTAGAATNYLTHKWLDFIFSKTAFSTPAASLHLGLSTTDPTDAGNAETEPSGGSYERKAFTSWDAAANGIVTNNGDITFITPTGAWGTIGWVFIADHASAGNILIYDAITLQIIDVGYPFEILDEDATITID